MRNWEQNHRHHRSRYWVSGLVLIGIGTLFLLDRWAFIDSGTWIQYWPFIIAIVGLGRIIDARSVGQASKGGFLIFVAFWLYANLQHLWGLNFFNSWPVILIALGLRHIIVGMATPSEKSSEQTPS